MLRCLLLFLGSVIASWGAAQPAPSPQHSSSKDSSRFVTVSGLTFLDSSGLPVRFHGINVCNKSRDQGYTGGISAADFAQIRSWGMNAIRLCIFWDGLEPRPGHFDKDYLDRIEGLVNQAKHQGLFVLLDMHQDLYSVKFGDGAPLWATLDDGMPHAQVSDWNDAYYESEDVQTALDHFWKNSPGPDGAGLQDHYAAAWNFVATRFRDEPAVLGYDLMNEPFPGRQAAHMEEAMLTRLSMLMARRVDMPHHSPDDLLRMENTPEGRRQIVTWMRSLGVYKSMLQAAEPGMGAFDRKQLMPMYQRVRKAVRQVDHHHILFLESNMASNLGIRTNIVPLVDDTGQRDAQQAYSPHIYDIVTDTPMLDLMSMDRIHLIFDRDRRFSYRVRMPMLVGEWGAFYMNPEAGKPTRAIASLFDRGGCSEMFWAYRPTLAQWPGLNALKRQLAPH